MGLAAEGAAGIFVADISLESATRVAAECKDAASKASFVAQAVYVDVTQQASVEDMTDIAVTTFGRVDYCVHCAGVSRLL